MCNQMVPEKRLIGKAYFLPVRVLSESFLQWYSNVQESEGGYPEVNVAHQFTRLAQSLQKKAQSQR